MQSASYAAFSSQRCVFCHISSAHRQAVRLLSVKRPGPLQLVHTHESLDSRDSFTGAQSAE